MVYCAAKNALSAFGNHNRNAAASILVAFHNNPRPQDDCGIGSFGRVQF